MPISIDRIVNTTHRIDNIIGKWREKKLISAFELSTNLSNLNSVKEISSLYQNFINQHGYVSYLHGVHGDLWRENSNSVIVWHSTYPDETLNSFSDFGMDSDVSIKHCATTGTGFWWRDAEPIFEGDGVWSAREKKYISVSEDLGIRNGLTLPLPGHSGMFEAIGLARQNEERDIEHRNYWKHYGDDVLKSAHMLHLALQPKNIAENFYKLSPREYDVLSFVASGLQQDAIATILGVGSRMIEVHMKSAKNKLKAKTSSHAVAKAVYFGIISP